MLRLGLDLGTNSIGWALYRLDGDGEPVELVDGGVLIHQDGRNPQNRASNAAERREKRGPRRNRDRMLRRRRRVAHLLHDLDLLPDNEDERAALRELDPMRLRAEALDRRLSPHELGRALLSFADRRGFKSNRKADGGEDGKIRQDVDELRRRMAQSGARTLGEYLWRRRAKGKTIRARLGNGLYPDREMVAHELGKIRKAQAPHHPQITDEDWADDENGIIPTLLYQRELRPVERGFCTLIPAERRAYKAYPIFQEFRIWQEVLNLEAARAGTGFQPLGPEDRQRIAAKLKSVKSQRFDQLLPDARVNLATAARTGLDGDQTAAVLSASRRFGKRAWAALGIERQQQIVERLLEAEDHDETVGWLKEEFGLDERAADAVASAPLPAGTSHLSKAAIERLLPYMRDEGLPYHEAVEAAGLGHHSDRRGDGKAERLPYYGAVLERDVVGGREDGRNEVERYGRIANPTVHIALGQVRRLFNAIADRYGKPDEVVVELARDLKQSRLDRERDLKENARNRERNERLRQLAADAGVADPSPHDMRKLRLWDEQGSLNARVCPFTGEVLSIKRVLSEQTEIEHILPYSRSLDDSMANTVLAMRSANREKGQKAPHEAWGHDPERYGQILARAAALPANKQWRFQENAMKRLQEQGDFVEQQLGLRGPGGFLARQLNDTRYLSRVTRIYLQAVVHPDRVRVTPGRLTAMLRRAWGLNSLLGEGEQKERDDHRHHLIDAAVVGLTSQSLFQKVATESGQAVDDLGGRVTDAVDDPWETFRQDLKGLVERVVVRHRPDHFKLKPGSTSGGLHNEMAYGIVDGPDKQGMMTLVETKPLAELDAKKLETIRDRALRQKLRELWESVDAGEGKPAEKWGRFTKRAEGRYGVRRVRVLLRLGEDSLAFIRDKSGNVYKAYKTHGNAYMDVWLRPDGKTVGETVTRFAAHQPGFRSEVKAEHPTAKKLMRLHINDMIAVGEGDERRIMRVLKLSGQRIEAVDHTAGGKAENLSVYRKSAGQVLQVGLRKVSVDVLGRVRDGGAWMADGRGRG